MTMTGKALFIGLGLAASAVVSTLPASAQYYGRGYDRYDRGYDGRYDRGYGYDRRDRLQAQKEAIRAQREAQKRAVRGGYYSRGGAGPNPYGPGAGVAIVPGPAGGYAVPVQPGNAGRYGNPNN